VNKYIAVKHLKVLKVEASIELFGKRVETYILDEAFLENIGTRSTHKLLFREWTRNCNQIISFIKNNKLNCGELAFVKLIGTVKL
jgi:hypothetical protein